MHALQVSFVWTIVNVKIKFTPFLVLPPYQLRGVASVNSNRIVLFYFSLIGWFMSDHKFDLLYSKRAFVHWYVGEGMEEVSSIINCDSPANEWCRVNSPKLVRTLLLLRKITRKYVSPFPCLLIQEIDPMFDQVGIDAEDEEEVGEY